MRMSTALTLPAASAALTIAETRMSVAQLTAQRQAIVDVMKHAMVEDIDYGTIPGTPKPTLYKPGSEKILALFHLAAQPQVEDLSTPDTIRYRITITVVHAPTGGIVGYGVGEASSAESKHQWRGAVCDEEWNQTPEDRRRLKWKKGERGVYTIKQVRADMEDVANTVLKMAKKRAQIDAVLTCTAASDIFAQDVEDLKDAGLDPNLGENQGSTQSSQQSTQQQRPADLQRKSEPQQQQQQTQQTTQQSTGAATITEQQGKRFWAVAMDNHGDFKVITSYLKEVHGVPRKDMILQSRYEEAMAWAEMR